uniref:hypothetical protein n=1 Tax=Sinorhizobium sp. M14 TaxID=430451 RepID=UPI000E1C86C7|nr:hypothetical protein [Sinorhizobium sp. M14]
MRPRRKIYGVLIFALVGFGAGLPAEGNLAAEQASDEALKHRFEYLSKSGNSNCSRAFMESIATLPAMAQLQGSCCSPMDEHRYIEQVKGLRKYKDITMIPADPYDLPAGIARQLIARYSVELTAQEQVAYDYAMKNSDEQGPCCCQCWRWRVYGGLAKYLIQEHGYTGEQVAAVWDLSDGCGGGEDHVHPQN